MGYRFQRRIKLSKGVHLNLSKSGVGMSTGIRGLGVSTGPRGSIVHAGLPGTGLSYRKGLGGISGSGPSVNVPSGKYDVVVDEGRKLRIVSPSGEYLDDNDIIAKRIRRTEDYKQAVRNFNKKTINEISENTTNITEIFKSTPSTVTVEYLHELLLRPSYVYEKKQFSEPYPTNETCIALIIANASFFKKLFWVFPGNKARYINHLLPARLSKEIDRWNQKKTNFDNQEQEQLDYIENANKGMVAENSLIRERLKGGKTFIMDSIDKIYSEITLPVDFSVDAEYNGDQHIVYLDVDLPEIEMMPNKQASELASGKISVKEKSSKQLKYDYARCVTGMACYLSGLAFNVSPEIEKIAVSGYTQRVSSKTGTMQNDYVYSVIFDRKLFSTLNFGNIDPIEAIKNFENKSNISATFEMKTIQPFTV